METDREVVRKQHQQTTSYRHGHGSSPLALKRIEGIGAHGPHECSCLGSSEGLRASRRVANRICCSSSSAVFVVFVISTAVPSSGCALSVSTFALWLTFCINVQCVVVLASVNVGARARTCVHCLYVCVRVCVCVCAARTVEGQRGPGQRRPGDDAQMMSEFGGDPLADMQYGTRGLMVFLMPQLPAPFPSVLHLRSFPRPPPILQGCAVLRSPLSFLRCAHRAHSVHGTRVWEAMDGSLRVLLRLCVTVNHFASCT